MPPELTSDQTPTEYPCCHQLEGRPHTDFCPVALGHITAEEADQFAHLADPPACSNPHANGLDGRGCQDETCPRHGDPSIDDCPPEGPPCYTLNPDGTTNAAAQCIDPACHYPNPHTHPDLIA